jgi:hypothetical protein
MVGEGDERSSLSATLESEAETTAENGATVGVA